MEFQRTFSGAPWEEKASYCRAVRAGDHIYVSGTVAVNKDGSVHEPGDGYAQAKRCFEIIEAALKKLGADCSNIVRTRMFVSDISKWEDYVRAHHEFFKDYPPAATMVEVKALIDPDMLIEIEADAVCAD